MSLYDVNGNVIFAGESPGAGNMGEISAETKTEEINLMTEETWTEGIWINGKGAETQNAAYASTGMIDVGEETTLRCVFAANAYKGQAHCYDADKNWLGFAETAYSTAGVDQTLTLASGTKYIRLTYAKTTPSSGKLAVYLSSAVTYYDFVDTATKKWTPLSKRAEVADQFSDVDFLLWNYTKWNGKVIVADGNSLVDSTNWIAPMGEILGAEVVNLGKSGSAITRPDQPSTNATIEQKRQYIIDNVANNYPDKADLILLQESSYLDGEPSDQMDGDSQSTSWMARMNYLIRCLKAKYPNVLIVLMPDNPWYSGNSAAGGNDSASLSGVNDQYLSTRNRDAYEAMKKLAEYNRLAFWHIDNSTPFNPLYLDNYYSQYANLHEQYPDIKQDGVHPHRYARAKGYAMAHWAAGLVFDPDAPNDAIVGWQNNLVKYEATTE